MGRTMVAIAFGMAALLAAATGCSSAGKVAGTPDAGGVDVLASSEVDAEGDGSAAAAETDASSTNSAACVSAGGACTAVSTCTVVGPVHCGPDSLCCLVAAPQSVADAAPSTPTDACAAGGCAEDASSTVVASADAAAD